MHYMDSCSVWKLAKMGLDEKHTDTHTVGFNLWL